MQRNQRHAFTLVEMLVATMVFVIGFVAIYSLFLAGINYRHESDRLTRTALVGTSLISNFRLQMQDQWNEVDDFIGDGDPSDTSDTENDFFPYPDEPSVWYCVRKATDASGRNNTDDGIDTSKSSTVRLEILLIDLGEGPASGTLTLTDILRRQFLDPASAIGKDYIDNTFPDALPSSSAYDAITTDVEKAIYILLWRKVLVRYEAVIVRR